MESNILKISIITVVFNGEDTITDCLNCIKEQTQKVEHIIIDGGSTDKTLAIVNKYSHVSKIISEPDLGIYDAMNKGIKLATGEIIGILNCDDFYTSTDTLQKVVKIFENKTIDSCYGNLVYVSPVETTRIIRRWNSDQYNERKFYWGWMPPHPTFFVRRSVYEKYGLFNLSLNSSADYELMLRFFLKHKIATVYIPEVLVKMRAGGVSNGSLKNRIKANKMDGYAWLVNGLKPYPWTIWLKPISKIKQYFGSFYSGSP